MGNLGYSTAERAMAGGGLAVFTAGCLFVGLVDPTKYAVLPPCPLLKITGFACPGCGLTRGFHALFHGDLFTALDFNALVPLYAFVFVYMVIALALISLRGRSLRFNLATPGFLWFFLGVSLVFGVLRNVPVHPLSVLFP